MINLLLEAIMSPDVVLSNRYIDVLEKTNQQLSLWSNPYGIIIAALSVLFTVLTIVAVVIIYRQGSEYKEKLELDRKFYREKMSEFLNSQKQIIEEKSKTAEELSQKIDSILEEYKKKLEESSESQKEEIQKAIDKLEIEKLSLRRDVGPITVTPNFDYSSLSAVAMSDVFSRKLHKCSHCGFGFYVEPGSPMATIAGPKVTCPMCQNTDYI